MDYTELNEQERNRRDSLTAMRQLGIEPYPAEAFDVNTNTREIKSDYKQELGNFKDVKIAGRIMSRRIMGAAAFIELQDEQGKIQVYIKRDEICQGMIKLSTILFSRNCLILVIL
jgi:lysyl-tRNA synthetase class 2